ncbi:MAG TPA: hypothetical protein VHM70_09535 [Polyangiaceae bacterium]|nr:hypothetical protein [Polyangiaceae bacterium]
MRGLRRGSLTPRALAFAAAVGWPCAGISVGLGAGFAAACEPKTERAGRDTGLECEDGSQCASNFCLQTRVPASNVCCVRACENGAVCRSDGTGCEFAPRPEVDPGGTASVPVGMPQAPTPVPNRALPSTSSGPKSVEPSSPAVPAATIEPSATSPSGPGDAGSCSDPSCSSDEPVEAPTSELDSTSMGPRSAPDASIPDASSSADDGSAASNDSDPPDAAAPFAGPAESIAPVEIVPTDSTPPAACDAELLANGDFEEGDVVWVTASTWSGALAIVPADDSELQQEGVSPQAGDYLGWLGGIPDNEFDGNEVRIEQPFNVPLNASSLAFKGYVRIATLEPDPTAVYDVAYVDVLAPGEELLWVPHSWSNLDASSDWVPFDFEVSDERLDAMRGKTLLLRIHSETDPQGKTSFWLDTLSMKADCAR